MLSSFDRWKPFHRCLLHAACSIPRPSLRDRCAVCSGLNMSNISGPIWSRQQGPTQLFQTLSEGTWGSEPRSPRIAPLNLNINQFISEVSRRSTACTWGVVTGSQTLCSPPLPGFPLQPKTEHRMTWTFCSVACVAS